MSSDASNHRSDHYQSLDTFSHPARISTVTVEFCAGVGSDRGNLRCDSRSRQKNLLSACKILTLQE